MTWQLKSLTSLELERCFEQQKQNGNGTSALQQMESILKGIKVIYHDLLNIKKLIALVSVYFWTDYVQNVVL